VKFLCDRCKTRYSIGDERVRGKILKIRCKTCANVITVREGMAADPDGSQPPAPEYPARAKKTTTIAPMAMSEGSEAAKRSTDPASAGKDRGLAGSVGPSGRGALGGPTAADAIPGLKRPGGPAGLVGAPAVGDAKDTVKSLGSAQAKRSGASDGAARAQGASATRAPAPSSGRGEPANALGAAFASAMAKPPPALEEEWYVSIDGEQTGPFSLAEAQGWVTQQAEDAELHCWSEGFDDWLPVDKVSHFRGLRKRPVAPAAPPPLPRSGGVPPRVTLGAPGSGPADDEPRPLFAATMASLERGAPAAANPGLPSPATPPARTTPPRGATLPPRGGLAGRALNGAGLPGREPGAAREADRRGDPGAGNGARPVQPAPGAIQPAGPAFRSVAGDPFDMSESGDAATQLEAMPFPEPFEPRRTPPPAVSADRARTPSGSDAALTTPHLPAAATLPGTGANAAVTSAAVTTTAGDFGKDGDEELAIGEVSRVVKLADITRAAKNPEGSGATRRPRPASVAGARRTGGHPILRSTGSMPAVSQGAGVPPDGALPAAGEGDPGMTLAPIRTSHRRGLIALLGVGGVMVLGVIGAVVLLVTTNDEPTGGNLDSVRDIDTSRPEDPITHRPIDPGPVGSASPPANPFVPRPTPHPRPIPTPPSGNHDVEPPAPQGNSLRGDEIEDAARKHQDVTQRCYMRSQRGADAILVGDVKKIAVTLVIDKDGNVSDVQLSEHAADNLGKCLSISIRGWKFRQSSGGTFRFSLNFVSG